MKKTYSSGVAFIFEGDTEQTFYEILISQFRGKHPEYSYSVSFDDIVNEVISESSCGSYSVIIRMNSVKTITQVAHSADWFNNSCKKKHPGIKWTVFLCYDTDSHLADITKFYEGDWLTLRRKLKGKNVEVIDLASRAMIEDLFSMIRKESATTWKFRIRTSLAKETARLPLSSSSANLARCITKGNELRI